MEEHLRDLERAEQTQSGSDAQEDGVQPEESSGFHFPWQKKKVPWEGFQTNEWEFDGKLHPVRPEGRASGPEELYVSRLGTDVMYGCTARLAQPQEREN